MRKRCRNAATVKTEHIKNYIMFMLNTISRVKKGMGANVSTSMQKAVSVVTNSVSTSCRLQQAVNQNITAKFDLTDTNCDGITFRNKTVLVGTCNLDAQADALATASFDLSQKQLQALQLGINVTTNQQERKAIIKQILEQTCASEQLVNQNINADIKCLRCNCQRLELINDADATTQCVIATVSRALNSEQFVAASSQEGDVGKSIGSILGGLISLPVLLILGGLLLLGVIFFAARAFFGKSSTTAAQPAQIPFSIPAKTTSLKVPASKIPASVLASLNSAPVKLADFVPPISTTPLLTPTIAPPVVGGGNVLHRRSIPQANMRYYRK